MWVFAAPSCSTCPQAVPPCPLPSCYAMTSSPPPPQEDPVALPWPSTYRPSYLFLCKKTRGWGPLQHAKAVLGMSTPPRAWHILTIVPHALLSALQTGRSFCKVRLSHQNTVMYLKVRTLYQKVGLSLWAEDASVQLDLRVGELMIQSMRCSFSVSVLSTVRAKSKTSKAICTQQDVQTSCLETESLLLGGRGSHWILFPKRWPLVIVWGDIIACKKMPMYCANINLLCHTVYL